jgi:hypothetical protein
MTRNVPSPFFPVVRRCALAALVAWLAARPAAAQGQAPPPENWTRGTMLNLFAGAGADSTRAGGVFGGSVGWEVTRRLAVEGTGTWLTRGPGADAFAGDVAVLAHFRAPTRLVPFLKGGFGLYRASFDPTRSEMPAFYRDRVVENPLFPHHAVFTDPSFVAGGGITAWLTERISLRPEVEAKIVTRGGHAHPFTAAVLRVGYHFQDHPVE